MQAVLRVSINVDSKIILLISEKNLLWSHKRGNNLAVFIFYRSKSFILRVDIIFEGPRDQQKGNHKSCSPLVKWRQNMVVYPDTSLRMKRNFFNIIIQILFFFSCVKVIETLRCFLSLYRKSIFTISGIVKENDTALCIIPYFIGCKMFSPFQKITKF